MEPYFLDLGTSWRSVVSSTPRRLYPRGKSPPVPIGKVAGWPPEPVWTTWRRENPWHYRDSNSDPSVVQPVASRYTDCSIPAHNHILWPKWPKNKLIIASIGNQYAETRWRQRFCETISLARCFTVQNNWASYEIVRGEAETEEVSGLLCMEIILSADIGCWKLIQWKEWGWILVSSFWKRFLVLLDLSLPDHWTKSGCYIQ
jgi:hypothetical protein